ncbi:hypothetical protein I553_2765 [Mycobacterium xenopi 4042]|uniref:Uncharacterized protein n=1 Tax=Mycobacterium xenopi 4042 TaxID=1299334 RepID=X8BKV4_MYCXE|nr:hypothetical protein I553_2765 [Mycobacterium xenopi 4042]
MTTMSSSWTCQGQADSIDVSVEHEAVTVRANVRRHGRP